MAPTTVASPFSARADREPPAAPGREPVSCVVAADPAELAIHFRIREEIFVREQALFGESDRDEHDASPDAVHVLALNGATAGGTVRLYPLEEEGLWKGDRLAVLRGFRTYGLGEQLVRFAVRTAGERGGRLMIAQVQPANVRFFEHLGWSKVGEPSEYVGTPHQKMAIPLGREA